jgi:DNA-binding MarR family transcriptional regulator
MSTNRVKLLRELEVELRRSAAGDVLFFQAIAERSGMNLTDLQCIHILASTGPITAGRLAEMMGLTTGAITGLINRLERAGYVRREPDPNDGRRVVIRPLPEKLESAGARFFDARRRAFDALASGYDDRDLSVVLDFMRRSNAMTEEETARIRGASADDGEGEFTAPLGSVQSGRLLFANGASRLTLRAGSGMDALYRARFEGAAPKVDVDNGTVTVRRSRRFTLFDLRRHTEEVTLNAAIPWEIEVRGGAARIEADLGGLELSSFVLKGGIGDLILTLPEPSGAIPVRLTSGASTVSIRRPSGVEARLDFQGGAGTLTFDEQRFDALGGKVRLQSPGYAESSSRYDIDISGGAGAITIR